MFFSGFQKRQSSAEKLVEEEGMENGNLSAPDLIHQEHIARLPLKAMGELA